MKRIVIAAVTCWSLLIPLTGFAQDTAYKSSGFSAQIAKTGYIKNLKVGKTLLIDKLFLYGNYKPVKGVEKHDARFFQLYEKSPCTISKPDAKTLIVEKKDAILGNKKYPRGAVYTEKITFTPDRISAEYEIKTIAPMAANAHLFSTLCELPLSFAGRGYKMEAIDGKESMGVLPLEYSPSDKQRFYFKKLAFAIPGGVMTLQCEQENVRALLDLRSWKSGHLRMDVYQPVVWKKEPVVYPPGTKFKWSFTISYTPVQE